MKTTILINGNLRRFRRIENPCVGGSIPPRATTIITVANIKSRSRYSLAAFSSVSHLIKSVWEECRQGERVIFDLLRSQMDVLLKRHTKFLRCFHPTGMLQSPLYFLAGPCAVRLVATVPVLQTVIRSHYIEFSFALRP